MAQGLTPNQTGQFINDNYNNFLGIQQQPQGTAQTAASAIKGLDDQHPIIQTLNSIFNPHLTNPSGYNGPQLQNPNYNANTLSPIDQLAQDSIFNAFQRRGIQKQYNDPDDSINANGYLNNYNNPVNFNKQIEQIMFKDINPTHLSPLQEWSYQQYLKNISPLDPISDDSLENPYNQRGLYQAEQLGRFKPNPFEQFNPYDKTLHNPDEYYSGITNDYRPQYLKWPSNPEAFWEMIPDENQNDPSVIRLARQLGVY